MTDSGPTRPPYRHVASFGQFEQALERRSPADIEATAGKRDQWSRARRPGRQMRSVVRRSSDARGNGRAGAEHLGMDPVWCDAQCRKALGKVAHERGGAADVEVAGKRQITFLDGLHIEMPMGVEIGTDPVRSFRRAVANAAMMVRQHVEQSADFVSKRMLTAAAGAI